MITTLAKSKTSLRKNTGPQSIRKSDISAINSPFQAMGISGRLWRQLVFQRSLGVIKVPKKTKKQIAARFKTNPQWETKGPHVNCAILFASCYKWVSPAGNLACKLCNTFCIMLRMGITSGEFGNAIFAGTPALVFTVSVMLFPFVWWCYCLCLVMVNLLSFLYKIPSTCMCRLCFWSNRPENKAFWRSKLFLFRDLQVIRERYSTEI
jgi:hypothetical protein